MQFVRRILLFLFSMSLTLATGLGLVRAAGDLTGQEADIRARDNFTGSHQAATSGNRSDLDMTASLRRALVQDELLSRNARDIKIITRGGVVTLQGSVDSPAEKSRIDQLAHQVSNIKQIDNQLEVNSNRQTEATK
ncbi:MAG: BON domain-containing protein [Candidatus Competibacteraceae bacterium]